MIHKSNVHMRIAAWHGFWQGLKEGPRVYFAPITPRVWRYAKSVRGERGLLAALAALLLHGPTLLGEGRLLPSGQVQKRG